MWRALCFSTWIISKSDQDMSNKTKKYLWSFIGICVLLVVIIVAIGSGGSSAKLQQSSFAQLAQKHFADVQASIPELHDIHCVDDTCVGVAYFNFNTLPADVNTIIRGNAAAYSKFETDNSVGNHVTIFAQLNGKDLFQCNAADGQVTSCTNQ
jgi:hypothetical protein